MLILNLCKDACGRRGRKSGDVAQSITSFPRKSLKSSYSQQYGSAKCKPPCEYFTAVAIKKSGVFWLPGRQLTSSVSQSKLLKFLKRIFKYFPRFASPEWTMSLKDWKWTCPQFLQVCHQTSNLRAFNRGVLTSKGPGLFQWKWPGRRDDFGVWGISAGLAHPNSHPTVNGTLRTAPSRSTLAGAGGPRSAPGLEEAQALPAGTGQLPTQPPEAAGAHRCARRTPSSAWTWSSGREAEEDAAGRTEAGGRAGARCPRGGAGGVPAQVPLGLNSGTRAWAPQRGEEGAREEGTRREHFPGDFLPSEQQSPWRGKRHLEACPGSQRVPRPAAGGRDWGPWWRCGGRCCPWWRWFQIQSRNDNGASHSK